jgi:DNA-binding NarL/FixJ family response regulator
MMSAQINKINIAIADDQSLFRQGLAALLREIKEFELVAEADGGNDFLDRLKTARQLPDIALIDLNMPGMNGVELNGILNREYPGIKVVVVTAYGQERFVSKMIEAGASGYLVKNCDTEELITCIKTIQKTGFYFNTDVLNSLRFALHHKTKTIRNVSSIPIELSPREQEILCLICKEVTNPEIADKLFLSVRTVEGHRNNLLAKTGCRNTAGLVIFAVRHGIYELDF